MKNILRQILIKALGLVNAYPTALTDKNELAALIYKLHPIFAGVKMVRLGPNGDGGYLVPDDLDGIEACFSPGVCEVSGFEGRCAELGMQVFLADRSVDGPAEENDKFFFTKKYVGATTSTEFMTIDDWVNESLPESNSDLLLQIDIEGYEYESFLSMSNRLLRRFRVIVVEFHNLDLLWCRPYFRLASPVFEKILQSHACVHIHPNNCNKPHSSQGLDIPPVMEFTFIRKDRVKDSSFSTVFPHPLDFDNENFQSLVLPKCWYR